MTIRNRSGRARVLILAVLCVLGACNTSDEAAPDSTGDGTADRDAAVDATDAGAQADASGAAGSAGSAEPSAGTGGDSGTAGSEAAGSDAPGSSGDAQTFDTDVHPLLVASCGSCHAQSVVSGPPRPGGPGEGGADGPGKFAGDDAAAAYAAVMPYVIAGDPEHSTLYIKISEDMPSTGGQRMPPALRQWDDVAIATVRDWISAGAPQR